MANSSDNLDRKKRRKLAQEGRHIPKGKRGKVINAKKRLKKIKKRQDKGLCGYCGKAPCLNASPCQEKR